MKPVFVVDFLKSWLVFEGNALATAKRERVTAVNGANVLENMVML